MIFPAPKKLKRKKLPSIPALLRKAEKAFNRHIRNRDAKELNGRCCTCNQPGNQAGHFNKKTHSETRFDPTNVHLQCVRCNHYLDGNEGSYALFIAEKYGMEHLKHLISQRGKVHKFTRDELNKIIEAYS